MWRALAFLLGRHRCRAEPVAAVFAAHLASQAKATEAAERMTEASDALRGRIEEDRRKIQERSAQARFTRNTPATSDARAQVEALLTRVEDRERDRRDP